VVGVVLRKTLLVSIDDLLAVVWEISESGRLAFGVGSVFASAWRGKSARPADEISAATAQGVQG
jgi:hypothetical protein